MSKGARRLTVGTPQLVSATEDWADSPVASWTPWPLPTSLGSGTPYDTSTVSSCRKSTRTAIRLRYQTLTLKTRTRGKLPAPTMPWKFVLTGKLAACLKVKGGASGRVAILSSLVRRFLHEIRTTPQAACAVPYDLPIPGYKTNNMSTVRLWSAQPKRPFDLSAFNRGNYDGAVAELNDATLITRVLYPNDNTSEGKALRLKQQYFWVSASLHDIVRRFTKLDKPWTEFPELNAIQLNDTHPTLSIPEFSKLPDWMKGCVDANLSIK